MKLQKSKLYSRGGAKGKRRNIYRFGESKTDHTFTDTYDLFLSRAEQYAKEVTDHVTKGAQMPTDEEMQEKIYQIYYEVLKEQAEVGMLYGRAEDVVLHIEKEGRGNYGIRQKDMKNWMDF